MRLLLAVCVLSALPALAADDEFGSLVIDLATKTKASVESLTKRYATEGGRAVFVDSKGRKFRLERRTATSVDEVRAQRSATLDAAKSRSLTDDAPDEPVAELEHVAVPKKVKSFASWYDPRGSGGKAPSKSADHTSQQTTVSYQGQRGTCAAFSSMAALEALINNGQKLSAEYAYWLYQGKSAKRVCEDPGTQTPALAHALRTEGVPNDYFWAYASCPKTDAPQPAKDKATFRASHVYFVPQQIAHFETYERGGKFFFRVVSSSGETLARSQGFGSKAVAELAVDDVLSTFSKTDTGWSGVSSDFTTCKAGDPAPCNKNSAGKGYYTLGPNAFSELYPAKTKPANRAWWAIAGIKANDRRLYSAGVNDPHFIEAVIDSGYNVIAGFDVAWGDITNGEVADVFIDDATGRPIAGTGEACSAAADCSKPSGVQQECSDNRCVLSGHSMLIVGYERSGNKQHGGGHVIVKNSWGSDNPGNGYVKLSYDYVRQYLADGVILTGSGQLPDGAKCNDHGQCANFVALAQAGSACCKTDNITVGTCTPMQKDYAGVYYCPAECVGRVGASTGTCGKDGLADDGEACKVNADCEGFDGLGEEGSACCGGTCAKTKQDWAGVYYCADVCVGSAGGKPGTCKDKTEEGGKCSSHADCKGFNGLTKKGTGCCGGKCVDFKKDWAGKFYCPNECVGAAGASAGTCPLKGKNATCKVSADCKGDRTCCGGKCQKKKKDWAGVYYCPNECVGSAGGKPGSCD